VGCELAHRASEIDGVQWIGSIHDTKHSNEQRYYSNVNLGRRRRLFRAWTGYDCLNLSRPRVSLELMVVDCLRKWKLLLLLEPFQTRKPRVFSRQDFMDMALVVSFTSSYPQQTDGILNPAIIPDHFREVDRICVGNIVQAQRAILTQNCMIRKLTCGIRLQTSRTY